MASASSPSEATPLLAPLRPASPAPAEQVPNPSAAPCRQLSTVDGVSVVLSLQLGSGPFTSPALVLRAVAAAAAASAASSPPAEKVVAMERSALLIWLLAAVPTYAAASCYAELGSRVPANGGPLAWLVTAAESVARARGRRGRRCKWRCGSGDAGGDGHSGKTVAAVVGALGVWVVKPASAAVLALVIGSHVEGVLLAGGRGASGGAGYGWATGGGEWTAYLLRTAVAWLVVAVLAWVNVLGVRWSSRLTGNLLAWKVAGVGFVIIVGWWTLLRGSHQVTATPPIGTPSYLIEREASIPSRATIGNYADAMLQAMYAYSGWETLAYIGGELRNPTRSVPRILNVSMVVVTVLSLMVNVSYFTSLSFDDIIRSPTVGLTFSEHFLGRFGGLVYSLVICFSTLGTLNVKTLTYSRLTQAAAEHGFLPGVLRTVGCHNHGREGPADGSDAEPTSKASYAGRLLGFIHRPTRYGSGDVPVAAIFFNTLLTALYVAIGDFGALIVFMGIVEYSVVVASLVGLVVLRLYHEPSPELRRQLAVENGEQAGESGEDNYDGVISRPTARLMAGVESELPRVSWPIVAVALVAYFTIVAAAVAKHPWIGMGCLSFCALTACVHRYIVPKAPKVEDAFRAEQGR